MLSSVTVTSEKISGEYRVSLIPVKFKYGNWATSSAS